MTNRQEPRLPAIFYGHIDRCTPDLWFQFVRFLGLAEHELQAVNSRKDVGITERKYQTLSRWQMFLGRKSDDDIERLLKGALDEVDLGRERCITDFPPNLQNEIILAREIYRFIHEHDGEQWARLARMKLNLPPHEVTRLASVYKEDTMERKYQTILRWARFNGIAPESIGHNLRNIREVMSTEQRHESIIQNRTFSEN